MRLRSPLSNANIAVRPGPLAATVIVHAAVAALLLIPRAEPVAAQKPTTIALFDVPPAAPAPEPARAAQPEPVPPSPPAPVIVPPAPLPAPGDTVVALLAQADATAAGGACDLTRPVQAALQASDPVRAGLGRIPRESRSVANAIMVWNAQWIGGDATLDQSALGMIRDVVAETVAAASPDCRLQPQGGPRLLILSGAGENVVLALGSGKWRWQDLLDTATAEPGASKESANISVSAGGTRASMTLR